MKRLVILTVIGIGALVALYVATRDTTSAPAGAPTVATAPAAAAAKPASTRRAGPLRGIPARPGAPGAVRDARGQPVAARAAAAVNRGRAVRDRNGDPVVPIDQLFDDLATFAAALATSRDPVTHEALTRTRLSILQEWAGEVRSNLQLSADEQKQFTAIIDGQARKIASGASKGAAAPSSQIRALLGPDRYARYEDRRKAFFPAGVHSEQVLP